MKRALVRRPLSLFLAGLWAVGCASMLDLDGYEDAITLLCQCPGFESIDNCVDNANGRLAFSSDAEREDWLEIIKTKDCDVVCDQADECYGAVPACREKRAGCECCFWNEGKFECTTGNCATCRTCSEVATSTANDNECVSGRALYDDLRQCACAQCPSECTGFCQGTDALLADMSDTCSMCLSGACSTMLTACMADKP